jgi:hypothetical protein
VTHSAADWRCAGHHPPTTASPSASSAATIQFDPAAGGPAGRIDRSTVPVPCRQCKRRARVRTVARIRPQQATDENCNVSQCPLHTRPVALVSFPINPPIKPSLILTQLTFQSRR